MVLKLERLRQPIEKETRPSFSKSLIKEENIFTFYYYYYYYYEDNDNNNNNNNNIWHHKCVFEQWLQSYSPDPSTSLVSTFELK